MSGVPPQTPQRPLPGAYTATPAPNLDYHSGATSQSVSRPGATQQQNGPQGQTQAVTQQRQQNGQLAGRPPAEEIKPIERASRTVNQTLEQESRYPALDSCVSRKPHRPTSFIKLTVSQRCLLRTMISPPSQHGHRFRRSSLTTYRTQCSPSSTMRNYLQKWGCSRT